MKSSLDRILIWSGCLSLLASIILFLFKQWNLGWEIYVFAIALPISLTLGVIASNFETGSLASIWKLKKAPRVLFIGFCVVMILFQFIGMSFAVTSICYYGISRIPVELLGYFFLVGFIYTVRILYIVTSPNRYKYLGNDIDPRS
jgi:hypothetical protein